MKTISLDSKSVTLENILEQAAGGEIVFLTRKGRARFALISADEGDQEVCALRSNAEFMAYLTEAEKRAHAGPQKSIEEIRALYRLPAPQASKTNGSGRSRRLRTTRAKRSR